MIARNAAADAAAATTATAPVAEVPPSATPTKPGPSKSSQDPGKRSIFEDCRSLITWLYVCFIGEIRVYWLIGSNIRLSTLKLTHMRAE